LQNLHERRLPPLRLKTVVDISMKRKKDKYFWLRDPKNPDVIDYLKSENTYAEWMMHHTRRLRTKLYKEMLGRIEQTDQSAPVGIDGYEYYYRTETGRQYEIYCRRRKTAGAPEEILLDLNEAAVGHTYCEVGAFTVSPDHRYLAYSIDYTGRERYRVYVKDLSNGNIITDGPAAAYYQAVWAQDSRTLFYTVLDKTFRPYRLMRHRVGSSEKDAVVYEETDPAFRISLSRSHSREYIFLRLESLAATEIHYLPADAPDEKFRLVHPRQYGLEYYLLHQGGRFLILTNYEAVNFRLMEAPITDPSRENWREIIPHRESVYIEDAEAYENHLVMFEREDGLNNVRIVDFRSGSDHYIEFPETNYVVRSGRNPEFRTTKFRFVYTSLVTPESIYEYNMDTRERRLLKQESVLGGYDPGNYVTERIYATAEDGVLVPISMVYRKGLRKDSSNPVVLHGYGAYGESVEPEFESPRLSLLDRGFIYAIAHVRGGSEFGRQWYEDGRLLNKKNTFTDFIVCAEHLIAAGFTSPERMIFAGFSAGGLLIGAVINMRPDLCAAAVADVPFVDIVDVMADKSIPLTVTEYDEWGNPIDQETLDYISSYAPLENIAPQDYPSIFIRAALNDPRVQYWEPIIWAIKLRTMKTDNNLLLLRTHMSAGHFGPSGRYDYLKELTFEYTFMLDVLGIET
jgi:oligopeptidase B